MPITVSCPACSSRFSLSDDLYRRRVVGSLVKVKCRYCKAEIAVDATEPTTSPKNEAPRKQPHLSPPRPKAITQLGLGTPPPPSALATTSPLPSNATRSPLPLNATVTPLPIDIARVTSLSQADADSIWSDEQTIAINVANAKAPPRSTLAANAPTAVEEEPEFVDAEEIPVSSSGAPTLDALTLEAGGAHVPHGKPAPDEFLVSLHASNESALGAPTIDVTSFAAEIPPSVDVTTEEQELEFHPAPPKRTGTVPLYDMNAVLPGIRQDASSGSAAPVSLETGNVTTDAPYSEGRSRERKFVIAPEAATATRRQKARKPSPLLWVALLTAAGAVGAGVGLRERSLESANEAALANVAQPAPTPVVNTEAALPAEPPTADTSEPAVIEPAASAAPPTLAVAATPSVPIAPATQNAAVATTRSAAPSTAAAVKGSTNSVSNETDKPSSVAEPAVEKPVSAVKPVEVHNAPPPAAPDTEFDRSAARNALASAAAQASSCRKEGDPSGTANLTITFAPSGRVTSAQIQGPPFSGTPTGGCIASTMRRASVPAFSGEYVTVSKTIVVQ